MKTEGLNTPSIQRLKENFVSPPSSLLVHLSPRSYSINCHKEQLLRLNDLEEDTEVVEDILEDLLLCDPEVRIRIIRVRAVVNNTIHVQIHVVKIWYL